MTFSSMTVANAVIEYLAGRDKFPANLLLQKILYYLNADQLIQTNGKEPLIEDQFEKWSYGPVSPVVYRTFSRYGRDGIKAPEPESFDDFIALDDVLDSGHYYQDKVDDDAELSRIQFLSEAMYDRYARQPFALVDRTHQEPAWAKSEKQINAGQLHIKYDNQEVFQFLNDKGLESWLKISTNS